MCLQAAVAHKVVGIQQDLCTINTWTIKDPEDVIALWNIEHNTNPRLYDLKDTGTMGEHVLGNSYLLVQTKIYRLWHAKAISAICTSYSSKMSNITGQSILLWNTANKFRQSKSLMQWRRWLHIQILYIHIDGSQ